MGYSQASAKIYAYGRSASPTENKELQVLQRMHKFLLPRGYQLQPKWLDDIAEGYEVTDLAVDNIINKIK